MKLKLITFLLFTSLFFATNPANTLNNKIKAGIALAATGAGAGVGLYFANHFYEKFKSINPKISHPELIKKRRQYLALALIFGAGGAAWLVGGGVWGISQLRSDPPTPMVPDTDPEEKPKISEFEMWRREIKRLVPNLDVKSVADETLTQIIDGLKTEEKEVDKIKKYLGNQENLDDFLKKLETLEKDRELLFPKVK